MTTAPRRRDAGFTLPEVMIAIVIMATIAAVMAGVVSVVLRTTPSAEARAEDARSVLGLVTWLPQDVDSTPPTGFEQDPAAASGCGVNPGTGRTNLLRMTWTERASGGTQTFVSAYHYVVTGDAAIVQRITCSGFGAPPFSNATTQDVTAQLPLLPATWSPGQPPAAVTITRDAVTNDVTLVNVALTMIDGGVVYTDSAPKNPSETLPTTTLPSYYPPPPSTTTFVNTPPVFVDQAFTAHPGTATKTKLVATDVDGDPISFLIDSIPTGWIAFLTGDVMTITPAVPASYPSTEVIEIVVDDQAGGLTNGYIEVTLVDPATTATTTTTTTTTTSSTTTTTTIPDCAVLSASISPSPVKNVQPDSSNQGGGNVDVGVLAKQVTITATTNEYCGGLEIRYDSGGVNSPPQLAMAQTSATTWSVTLSGRDEGSSETWSDGAHAIRFFDADGGPWGSVNLQVN